MKKEWVLPLRDQCKRSRVPFFFKQWGGVRKKKAGVSKAEPMTNSQAASGTQSYLRQTAPPPQVKSERVITPETYFPCPRWMLRAGAHWPLRWLRPCRCSYRP
jgi:hypothetical protein